MPIIEVRRLQFLKYIARATVRISGLSEINYEHFIRGIFSSRNPLSTVITIGSESNIYISAFGRGNKNGAIQKSLSNIQAVTALLSGNKFSDDKINSVVLGENSALMHIVGLPHIGHKDQINELLQGIRTLGLSATIILNAHPVIIQQAERHNVHDRLLEDDTAFAVSYVILVSEVNIEALKTGMQAIVSLLGSIYDSEHSELAVRIETKQTANILEKLLWGELHYATIMTTRELEAFFQFPQVYGVQTIKSPDMYVPAFSEAQKTKGIEIGTVIGKIGEKTYPAYFDPNTIFQNVAIWGAVGLGKSTLVKHLITGLHNDYNIHLLIFDLHNEYRSIVPTLKGEPGKDILIFNPFIKTFALNPLEIPAIAFGKEKDIIKVEVAENFISLLIQMWTLGEVQEQRCRTHLYELYEMSTNPTLSQLIALLEDDRLTKTKKDEDNLPSKMGKFVSGFYGEIFNQPHTSLPFNAIAQATTIFELGELPIELRTFFVTVFLNQWWNFKRVQKHDELTPNVLVLDEFHHYDNMAIPRKLLSEGRKYRQGIICSHQGPHQITDEPLLGELIRNTVTKIIFKTLYQRDLDIVMASLGTKDRTIAELLTRLELGEAVVSLYGVPGPFRIVTRPFPEMPINISDEGIRLLSENLIHTEKSANVITGDREVVELGDTEERRFLQLLYEHPHAITSDIISLMRIMRSRGWDIKKSVMDKGLIIEEEVRFGKGRPMKVLKLTENGYHFLGMEKNGLPAHYGKEEHLRIIDEASRILTDDGWVVEKENGADIRAEKAGVRIAIEVETCKGNNEDQIVENILKNLKWADGIIVISPNQQTRTKIGNLIRNQGIEKVVLLTYHEMSENLNAVNGNSIRSDPELLS